MPPRTDHLDLDALGRRGFAIAYRMLGSVTEAEDVVQEALLRLSRTDGIDEPAAWITTVVTRLSIDYLRLARVRRETYVGPWLPEPLIEETAPGPALRAELSDSLSQAFLVVLEQANCRQLVVRAKRHLAAQRPRFDADAAKRDELLERFLAAAADGDLGALEELLSEDAVLYGDGGGKAQAATEPVVGGAEVARFVVDIGRRRDAIGAFELQLVSVNGQPGRILRRPDGEVWDVLSIDVLDGRIQAIRIVRNPDKLAHL